MLIREPFAIMTQIFVTLTSISFGLRLGLCFKNPFSSLGPLRIIFASAIYAVGQRFGLYCETAVRPNGDDGTAALFVFFVDSEVRQIVDAHAVSQPYALILDGPVVEVVVAAEYALGGPEAKNRVEERADFFAAANSIVAFACKAVVICYVGGVFVAVGPEFFPCVPILRKRDMEENHRFDNVSAV